MPRPFARRYVPPALRAFSAAPPANPRQMSAAKADSVSACHLEHNCAAAGAKQLLENLEQTSHDDFADDGQEPSSSLNHLSPTPIDITRLSPSPLRRRKAQPFPLDRSPLTSPFKVTSRTQAVRGNIGLRVMSSEERSSPEADANRLAMATPTAQPTRPGKQLSFLPGNVR